jgi:hypothetical protein
VFDPVESLDRLSRKIAEKIAGTQMAIKAAFNAAQAGHHKRPSIFPPKHVCAG